MLFAPDFAEQHSTQLFAPVNVLRIFLLNQTVVVALTLFVRRTVELLSG